MIKMQRIEKMLYGVVIAMILGVLFIATKLDTYAMGNGISVKGDNNRFNPRVDLAVNDFKLEAEYVEEWLRANGYGQHNVVNPRKVYSVNDKYIGIYYDIDNDGYVILNTINYDIMEFSLETRLVDRSTRKLVYAGPLSVFDKIDDCRYYLLNAKKTVLLQNIDSGFVDFDKMAKKSLSQKMYIFDKEKSKYNVMANGGNPYETGSLKKSLAPWDTEYACMVDSAAIILRYLYLNVSSSFLPSGYTTMRNAQKYLCDYRYMVNVGMTSGQAVNGGAVYRRYHDSFLEEIVNTGMNQYLKDRGLRNWSATNSSYSFNTIKTQINADRPVEIGLNGDNVGHPNWGDHAVVVHGYMIGYAGDKFLYINDTFGHNGIIINGDAYLYTSYGMWYIH